MKAMCFKNSFETSAVIALLLFTASIAQAALNFSDNFESYSTDPTGQSGGTGDWTTAWTQGLQNSGGSYLNGDSKIDGTKTYGLYGNGGSSGTSRNRGFTATTSPFTLTFSFRADYNVTSDDGDNSYERRIAFTLRNGNSTDHFLNQRLSFFFAEGNSSFQWYDGADHSTSLIFSQGAIYDVSVTLDPSTRAYSFTATQRGGGSASSSGNWTLGANGESLDSLALLMRGPAGGGNDAFFDSIEAVPEPVNVALAIFGAVLVPVGLLRILKACKLKHVKSFQQWRKNAD